jgi:hypothetical protein
MPNADRLLDEFVLKDIHETEFLQENEVLRPLLDEIEEIQNQSVQYFVRSVLLKADEFWYAPSDNMIGTHPDDEYTAGGLLLHTKRVVRAAKLLCEAYCVDTDERDMIIAACILHDTTKAIHLRSEDDELFFDPMHPYTVGAFVRAVRDDDKIFGDESQSSVMYLKDDVIEQILRLVRVHLGIGSPVPETIPMTTSDMIVHLANLTAANLDNIKYGRERER